MRSGLVRAAVPALAAIVSAIAWSGRAATEPLPDGFVYMRQIEPSIIEDIRYATPQNFTGAVVPGYLAPACILRREVALALQQVQHDLRDKGLGLKVFDCFRPERAVRALVAWATRNSGPAHSPHNPRLSRRELIASSYISTVSHHARGLAVDLTLVTLPAIPLPDDAPRRNAPCTAPVSERAPDGGLDMGTSFDCFDPASAPGSRLVGPDQRANRKLLSDAMTARGFRGLPTEWWHFTYRLSPSGAPPRDFPVVAPAPPN